MNLIIDVGNTLTKLAVFDHNELIALERTPREHFQKVLQETVSAYPDIEIALVSAVGGFSEEELQWMEAICPVIELSHTLEFPFENCYATPTTLGVDRLGLIAAAAVQYPDENVLVIDAGSAITFDFLNADNQYLGGAISPGVGMRYKALHTFTANLPLLETQLPNDVIGDSTANSMHSGVVNGVLREIDGVIEQYIENFEHLTVILTGGDADFLRENIKNDIFAHSNFLLEGLNYILEHNKH